ncbi:hybrid sensor histidine kinase/response regulator [Prolixibacteraceae bacterium JC049]|nr:hybrid sensor histidine kinase/response regulator [Prolixibacteraceae bacterium JC049]
MLLHKIYFLLLMLLFTVNVQSQTSITHKIWDSNSGMAGTDIHDIIQDSWGYLWIGTEEGLNCFNGNRFKVFRHILGNENSLLDNNVSAICNDDNHNIWIATAKGLHYFSKQENQLFRMADDWQNITDLAYKNNKLYIVQNSEIKYLVPNTSHPAKTILDRCSHAYLESFGASLYFANRQGIWQIDDTQKAIHLLQLNHRPGQFIVDLEQNIWWSKDDYLYLKSNNSSQISSFEIPKTEDEQINGLVLHPSGKIWLSTTSNLFYSISKKDTTFSPIITQLGLNADTYHQRVQFFMADNAANIWGNVRSVGLVQLKEENDPFLFYNKTGKNQLPDKWLRTVFEDHQQNIWVGSNSGMSCWNKQSDNWQNIQLPIATNQVSWITASSDHTLWAATDKGVCIKAPTKDRWEVIKPLSDFAINQIYPYRGKVWLVADNGEIFIGKKMVNEWAINSYKNKQLAKYTGKNRNGFRVIHVSKNNQLWLGGIAKGLHRIDLNTNEHRYYSNNTAGKNQLNSSTVFTLTEDLSGTVYAGTGNGIAVFNPNSWNAEILTTWNGITSNVIYGIQADSSGNLWVATNNGLTRFNIQNKNSRNFYFKGDYSRNVYTKGVSFNAQSGKIYFGTNNGLLHFKTNELKTDTLTNQIRLTNLNINNIDIKIGQQQLASDILVKHIDFTSNINLKHNLNNLRFRFEVPSFNTPNKVKYRYRLKPINKEWHITSNQQPEAVYNQLSPGSYQLEINAASNDGIWQLQIKTLNFSIAQPYWLTWWAFALYTLLLLIITVAVHRIISNRRKLRNSLLLERLERKKEEELNDMKMRFFTNISHELRTPLTLIVGPLDDAINEKQHSDNAQLKMASRNAKHLQRLVNQLLDFRKAEMSQITPNYTPADIKIFIADLFHAFDWQANEKQIHFQLSLPETSGWCLFDADLLEKIIFNLLSNAFKYTPANGNIQFELKRESDNWIIAIHDSGKGISKEDIQKVFQRYYQGTEAKPGTGIGLALTRELTELQGGNISVQSKENKGSIFTIQLPLRAIEQLPQPAPTTANESQLKILLVEDNTDVLTYIKQGLSPFYQITEAMNGVEALEKLTEQEFDLIVSDVMMPLMDGTTLCQKIKADITTSHIPVILLTALSESDEKIKGIESGADAYITKPFNMAYLKTRIEKLVEGRAKMRELWNHETPSLKIKNKLSIVDQRFIEQLETTIKNELANPDLDIQMLCDQTAVSRSLLHTKLKKLFEITPNDLIRKRRMEVAKTLLLDGYTITEVAYKVGYNDPKYFSSSFKKVEACTPSQFKSKHKL